MGKDETTEVVLMGCEEHAMTPRPDQEKTAPADASGDDEAMDTGVVDVNEGHDRDALQEASKRMLLRDDRT
jgi:hypothetical protein